MVLVAMGKDNTLDAVSIGFQIGDIRNYNVDAVHLLVRETQSAVNNDYISAAFYSGHVLSYLAESSQRNNFNFRCHILPPE